MGNAKGWRRHNGEGSVFETTNNGYAGWLATIDGVGEDGRAYRITGWSRNSAQEAVQRRHKNLQKALTGQAHSAAKRGGMKVKEAYPQWLDRPPARSPNGRKAVESSFKWVLPYFADRSLPSLTEEEVEKWLEETLVKDGCGPSARANVFTNFKAFLNWSVRKGYLPHNPLGAKLESTVRPEPAVNKLDLHFISKRTNIVRYLLDEIGEDLDHKNREWLPLLGFLTLGLRRGELLGLHWDQVVNLNSKSKCRIVIDRQLQWQSGDGWVIRQQTKGKKPREIPCPDFWYELLQEQKAKNLNAQATGISKNLVFLDSSSAFLKYDRYYAIWRQCLQDYINKQKPEDELAVEDYFRPHYMRKISVSLAHSIGLPKHIVMEIIGHNSEDVHSIYHLLSREDKTEAITQFGEALKIKRKRTPAD